MAKVSTPSRKRILIILVKAPIVGDVKTRLLPTFSGLEAANLYRSFVLDTITNMSKSPTKFPYVVAYQSHPKFPNFDWVKSKAVPAFFKQDGSNIRDRLIHAFGCHFGKGYQQIVIIGSDSPHMSSAYVEQAFQRLDQADVVLGPSPAGGYCLVGLSRPCLKLFDDVVWSSDQVYERTAQNAYAQNYKLKVLSQQYYVETIDDVKMLQCDLDNKPALAPHTHEFLQTIGKHKSLFTLA